MRPYVAEFSDPQGRYAGEYTGDVSVRADAASFDVARGATATVSASLATGAVITGLAVDAKTDEPVPDACPGAYLGNAGDWVRWQVAECSGPDGRFTVRGLQAGSYTLHLGTGWHTTHASTWAFKADSQATADLITVSTGQENPIRDVKLDPSGAVSGRITDQCGQPVAGAWVNLDGFYPGRGARRRPEHGPHGGRRKLHELRCPPGRLQAVRLRRLLRRSGAHRRRPHGHFRRRGCPRRRGAHNVEIREHRHDELAARVVLVGQVARVPHDVVADCHGPRPDRGRSEPLGHGEAGVRGPGGAAPRLVGDDAVEDRVDAHPASLPGAPDQMAAA